MSALGGKGDIFAVSFEQLHKLCIDFVGLWSLGYSWKVSWS